MPILAMQATSAHEHPDAQRLRVYTFEAPGQEPVQVVANLELWEALYGVDGDPVSAWTGLFSALLRDPDFLFY